NQLEAEALVTGEYAAVVDRRKLGVGNVPAVLHQALEPGVGVQNDGLDRRARLGARGLETVRRRLEGRRFDRLHLDADLAEQVGEVGVFEQHADRADQRRLLGD